MPMDEQELTPERRRKLWIIWAAITFSTFIYGGIAYFPQIGIVKTDPDPDFIQTLTLAFGAISTAAIVGQSLLSTLLARALPFEVFCIMRWALSESVAIYGLVLFILSGSWPLFLAFLFPSLVMLLLLFPGETLYMNYMGKRR